MATLLFGKDRGESVEPASPPFVEFAGCVAVSRGPVCELGEGGEINVWAKAPPGTGVTLQVDGRPFLAHEKTFLQGGARLRLRLPEESRELVLTLQRDGARARFRLLFRREERVGPLEEAERLRQSGQSDAAGEMLSRALEGEPGRALRARLLSKLARVDLGRGEPTKAITRLKDAIALHRAEGRVSDAANDGLTLVYTHIFHGRSFPEARRALEDIALLFPSYPEGPAWAAYYAALLASETGDFRSALSLLRGAAEGVERLGIEKLRLEVTQLEADVLQRIGRAGEAEALLGRAEEVLPAAKPCQRASLLNDIGYNALLIARAGGAYAARLDTSFSALGRALDLYAEGGPCPRPRNRANVLTNLAHASLSRGAGDEARAYVARARGTFPAADARMTTEWVDIEGQVFLAEGRADLALRAYDDLRDQATRGAEPEGRFVAELGRARALAARGQTSAAADAYTRAEAISREWSLLVPLGEGRAAFLGRFEEGALEHVDLLLDVDPEAALLAARRARVQMLSALQWSSRIAGKESAARAQWEEVLSAYRRERLLLASEAGEDWKLAADQLAEVLAARRVREAELKAKLDGALGAIGVTGTTARGETLPPPLEGELVLAYFPVRGGLAGFAWTREGIAAKRLGSVDRSARADALAAILLGPFEAQIDRARRIRVVSQGTLDRIDVHALPWKNATLLARLPVVYGVDMPLPGAGLGGASGEGAGEVLVVGDTRGDLPAARREAEAVVSRLERRNLRVRRLYKKEATHGALRGALEDPSVAAFHYAGHGFFKGRDGWESGLPLAGGAEFSLGDVLSLVRVPRHIVLSGCETGRTEVDVPVEGLGLGQAFVVAGAASVVATSRPVDDHFAEVVMAGFYGVAEGGESPRDMAEVLRLAVLDAARESPSGDWASFRVLVP